MSDDEKSVVSKEVAIVRMVEPKYLTLTGRPANQIAFRIVRDDEGVSDMALKSVRGRRKAGDGGTSIVYIDFNAEDSDEHVAEVMASYGIATYTVEAGESGVKRVRCSDLPEGATTMQVTLASGVKATVIRSTVSAPADDTEKANIAVSALTFDKAVFPTEVEVRAYLSDNYVDISERTVENADTEYRVIRTETAPDEETRKVQVDDGVMAVIVRADMADVPLNIVEVVSEKAYGSWGWGQLDFAARLADVEFSEVARTALSQLEDLCYELLFWSQLPVAVRKELLVRATSQFSAYVGSLLDALPTQVVIVTRNDIKQKESAMPNQPAPTQSAATEGTASAITREDVAAMVAEAVAAAITRNEGTPADAQEGESAAPADAAPAAPVIEPALAGSLEAITRSLDAIATTQTAVADRLAALEGVTVVRSDNADGGATVPQKTTFAGVFARGRNR